MTECVLRAPPLVATRICGLLAGEVPPTAGNAWQPAQLSMLNVGSEACTLGKSTGYRRLLGERGQCCSETPRVPGWSDPKSGQPATRSPAAGTGIGL